MTRVHGRLVGMLLGGELAVLISDAAVAEQVLVKDIDKVGKAGVALFTGVTLAENGILAAEGALWLQQRRLSNPAFREAATDAYFEAMFRCANALVEESWAGGGCREVGADFNELTLRIAADALFAFRPSAAESKAMSATVRLIVGYLSARAGAGAYIPQWLPTPGNVRYKSAVARLEGTIYRIIEQRRAQPQPSADATSKCLLDALLGAMDSSEREWSADILRDVLMTLLLAGGETSATSLGWTCALLAHHPQHQAIAHAEIADRADGGRIGQYEIGSLHYLEAIILESMRLYPPAHTIGRRAAKDMQLGKYLIPAGTKLLVNPYLMHRDPECWPEPHEFRPQRWLQYLEGAKPGAFMGLVSGFGPNGAYVPFGAGPRTCIGNYFAMQEMIVTMASVLQKFKLEPMPGVAFPAGEAKMVLRAKEVHVRLEKRRS